MTVDPNERMGEWARDLGEWRKESWAYQSGCVRLLCEGCRDPGSLQARSVQALV